MKLKSKQSVSKNICTQHHTANICTYDFFSRKHKNHGIITKNHNFRVRVHLTCTHTHTHTSVKINLNALENEINGKSILIWKIRHMYVC